MTRYVRVAELQFRYRGTERVIGPVTFMVERRDRLAIVGPSGCGKSTLLRLICGLLPDNRGDIVAGSVDLLTEVPSHLKRGLGFVFQGAPMLPHLSALENVVLPLAGLQTHRQEALQRGLSLLGSFGLELIAHALPEQLSGGMRTRVSICRALIADPTLLLLDEPFDGLDFVAKHAAFELLDEQFKRSDCAGVLVTHSLEDAQRFATRALVLSKSGAVTLEIANPGELSHQQFASLVVAASKE